MSIFYEKVYIGIYIFTEVRYIFTDRNIPIGIYLKISSYSPDADTAEIREEYEKKEDEVTYEIDGSLEDEIPEAAQSNNGSESSTSNSDSDSHQSDSEEELNIPLTGGISEPSNLSSAGNLLKKSLQSFIEDHKDLYLFHGDLTAKKLKGNNKNAIHIAK